MWVARLAQLPRHGLDARDAPGSAELEADLPALSVPAHVVPVEEPDVGQPHHDVRAEGRVIGEVAPAVPMSKRYVPALKPSSIAPARAVVGLATRSCIESISGITSMYPSQFSPL